MAEPTQTAEVRANASAGHLSVHVEGAHPADVPFLFEQPAEAARAGLCSARSISHVVSGLLRDLLRVRYGSQPTTSAAVLPDQPNSNIVWLSQPGPGGGGGGGGNQMKEPPRAGGAARQGQDYGSGQQAAEARSCRAGQEGTRPGRAAEHSGEDARRGARNRCPARSKRRPDRRRCRRDPGRGGGAGTGTGTGIGPGHAARVLARAPAAAPAAASIGRATA